MHFSAFQSLNKMMLLKQFKITTAKYLLLKKTDKICRMNIYILDSIKGIEPIVWPCLFLTERHSTPLPVLISTKKAIA